MIERAILANPADLAIVPLGDVERERILGFFGFVHDIEPGRFPEHFARSLFVSVD